MDSNSPTLRSLDSAVGVTVQEFTSFFSDGVLRQELDDNFLESLCQNIECLDELEFNALQETLLQIVIFEWPKNCCIVTIEVLANIYAFISSIAPEEIVEEYLTIFSRHSMPPQIKYIIYPSVLKYSQLRNRKSHELKPSDLDLIFEFTRINWERKDEVTQADCEFIKLFWNRLRENWIPRLGHVLLPICANMLHIFALLDYETINVVIQTVQQRFLEIPITLHHILSTSVILFGLQRVQWKRTHMWDITSDICIQLVRGCCQHKRHIPAPVQYFGIQSVTAFLDRVEVESENMTNELSELIKNELPNERKPESKLPLSVNTIAQPIIPKATVTVKSVSGISNVTANIMSEPSIPKTVGSTENGGSAKKKPGRYLEVLEKLMERMKGQEFEFSPEEESRLNIIVKQLQSFKG